MSQTHQLSAVDLEGIDFIDMGASSGGSLRWASEAFGGSGLGVDLSTEKVRLAREAGFNVAVQDARRIDAPDGSVRFCTLMDFLEHLPLLDDAAAALTEAHRLAREFVYVSLPNFDREEDLRRFGVKRYFADWSGHTLHLGSAELKAILSKLAGRSVVYRHEEILDTFDRRLLPLSAPCNCHFHDPAQFDAKPFHVLPRKTFYARTLAVLVKDDAHDPDALLGRGLSTTGYLTRV